MTQQSRKRRHSPAHYSAHHLLELILTSVPNPSTNDGDFDRAVRAYAAEKSLGYLQAANEVLALLRAEEANRAPTSQFAEEDLLCRRAQAVANELQISFSEALTTLDCDAGVVDLGQHPFTPR